MDTYEIERQNRLEALAEAEHNGDAELAQDIRDDLEYGAMMMSIREM